MNNKDRFKEFLNKTIKKVLEKSLGINQEKEKGRREDFMEFFGVWSDSDLKEFNKTGSEFNQVDPGEFAHQRFMDCGAWS